MSAAHAILLACPLPGGLADGLSGLAEVQALHESGNLGRFLAERGQAITVLVTTGTHGASGDLIRALPRLQAICSLGVGFDTIDLDTARRQGVMVSNTPDVLNDCVADLAMGLLIDVVRGLSLADRHVRRGHWPAYGPTALTPRVSGKRLGLLGMGRIAQAIAKRAAGFDMDIRYHCRTPNPALPWRHESALMALAAWSDFLVVACTGGPGTHHLVSAEVLQALGPKGYLVNVARGSVVDEAALVDCLQSGRLAGAGLDVVENEPHVPAALLTLENVVLLPHVASGTRETRLAMAELVLANVASFLESGRLVTGVD